MGVVYKATNLLNGKIYIGKTIRTLASRKYQHLKDAQSGRYSNHFHNALRHYDEQYFDWEVLAEATEDAVLNVIEKLYIQLYNSYTPEIGYNSTLGGDGGALIDTVKKKISQTKRNNPLCGEKHFMYGKHHTEDTKQKIRDTKAKNPILGEKHHMHGKHHTEESKRKISESKKGTPSPYKGIPMSEEAKKKLSKAKIGVKLHRRDDSYSNTCVLCDTEFSSRTNSTSYCSHCAGYFNRTWLRKLRKLREEGRSIMDYLAKRDRCDTLLGNGRYIVVCKVCGMSFRALTSSYRFCPTCKEARDGD